MSSKRATKVARRKRKLAGRKADKMPRATVSMAPQHHDLKSLPEGFVELRRMTYGELMTSQDLSYEISLRASAMAQSSNGDGSGDDFGVKISRAKVQEFQFRTCVVDHNLEDDGGRKLDFRKAPDVHLLDGRIGQEIEKLIDDSHNWEKSFPNSETSSSDESSASASQDQMTNPSPSSESTPSPASS